MTLEIGVVLTVTLGLSALIGIPGLGLYFTARALGVSLTITPSTRDGAWWQLPVLIASAFAKSWAEEVVMVAYLYQGLGGFVGNVVMGLVLGRVWQRTNRLWMLVGAHALIDVVAFVGYAALSGRVGWLP